MRVGDKIIASMHTTRVNAKNERRTPYTNLKYSTHYKTIIDY